MPAAAMPLNEPPAFDLENAFRRHGRDVFRAALRVTGSESDAEDVVQTVFLRLLAHGHERRLEAEAGAYLRRAAVNAGLDVLRRRKAARAVPLADDAPLADESARPERRIGQTRLREALHQALGALSPRAAEIFALRFFEDLSNGEIADLLGTSPGVVAVTLHRARRSLQQELRPLAGEMS